jgi:hypothetical protein
MIAISVFNDHQHMRLYLADQLGLLFRRTELNNLPFTICQQRQYSYLMIITF